MNRRWQIALISLAASAGVVKAQSGGIAGRILFPDGSSVAQAPVQAKNKTDGAAQRMVSAADGRYSFAALAQGTWELSVSMPCCAYARFTRDVTVEAGKTAQLDARLVETINGTTLGDDPGRLAAVMLARDRIPVGTAPRAADGKPDLSGVWLVTDDPFPTLPEVLPWVGPILAQRTAGMGKDHPHNHCLPGSPPVPASSSPFIAKMVQTPALLVLLFEDTPGFRQIFLDGRAHPANFDPSWMGHSTGKWEGDTLVVDTVGVQRPCLDRPAAGRLPAHR